MPAFGFAFALDAAGKLSVTFDPKVIDPALGTSTGPGLDRVKR
jgi:hypothetical protein